MSNPLKSLEEYNAEIQKRYDEAHSRPTGIACPDCGTELNDLFGPWKESDHGMLRVSVCCPKCGYTGFRLQYPYNDSIYNFRFNDLSGYCL
jgi:predicted RNA-binding Zn-ribbon protein involved in translation (DUF1610 family)